MDPKFCLSLVWIDRNETRLDWFLDRNDLVPVAWMDEDQPNRNQLEAMRDRINELLELPSQYWEPESLRSEYDDGEETMEQFYDRAIQEGIG